MCLQTKPLSEFYTDKRAKDGRQARCKPCHTRVAIKTRDRKKQAKHQQDYQARNRGKWKTLPLGTTKVCTGINTGGGCQHEDGPELYATTEFFHEKAKCKYGLDPRCKACRRTERK
jgi:hypothetical protein